MNVGLVKEHLDNCGIKPHIILDIGANIGQFYREWRDIYPEGPVISIEANDLCMEQLRQHNPNSYNLLLSDDVKTNVKFHQTNYNPLNTGDSIYKEITAYYSDDLAYYVLKDTTTLDIFLLDKPEIVSTFDAERELPIDLIKMDVQGSELDILKGSSHTLKRVNALLLEVPFEDEVYNEGAPTREDIEFWLLENWGEYKSYVIDNNRHPILGRIVQQDVLYILS